MLSTQPISRLADWCRLSPPLAQ